MLAASGKSPIQYPPLPVLSAKDDLPGRYPDSALPLQVKPNLKRNFALFPVLDWIAEITSHIPDKGEQLARYYGTYSNVSRGKRKKEEHKKDVIGKPEFVEVAPPPISKELKKRW